MRVLIKKYGKAKWGSICKCDDHSTAAEEKMRLQISKTEAFDQVFSVETLYRLCHN